MRSRSNCTRADAAGQVIVATQVTQGEADYGQLMPVLEGVEENAGVRADVRGVQGPGAQREHLS